MTNDQLYNWTITKGDYHRKNGEYDKLYQKGRKRDRMIRALIWMGSASLTYIVFFKVLAFAAAK